LYDITLALNLCPLSSTKHAHGLSLTKLKKWGKEKGTFVEDGNLLEDSCRSKRAKIQRSGSKFEPCSGVCVWANKNFGFPGQMQ